jgi:hypothetical protein
MKIHIISNEYETNPDQVISRMFLELAKNAHFTIGTEPDDNADVNYFSLYLLYPKSPYTKTKTAALFSHKEENSPAKAKEWDRVAKLVDLRLCWAEKYKRELEQFGLTRIVIAPLDHEKFNYE